MIIAHTHIPASPSMCSVRRPILSTKKSCSVDKGFENSKEILNLFEFEDLAVWLC